MSPEKQPVEGAVEESSTTAGLPVSPSLGPVLAQEQVPSRLTLADVRVVTVSALALVIGIAAAFVAEGLTRLIWLVTNFSFHGTWSAGYGTPLGSHLGPWLILVPVAGGLVVGLMARFGSAGIRGHGIPEAMEQVLINQSRIAPRLMFLKPLSAAVAIGTGGPFGMEGPIIATGGAMGSVLGQWLPVTAHERKALLAAGAAAGMSATFASPIAAVLLAIELLLFELRPRSIVPVAIASAAATGVRAVLFGTRGPVFAMPEPHWATLGALACYILLGLAVGLAAVGVTRAVYWAEDSFRFAPVHWMWWPAIGAIPVGVIGYFCPRTLGVGYENITDVLAGRLAVWSVVALVVLKFISWAISLGSGTSGGTLAPLFTIGGGMGLVLGALAGWAVPACGVDPRVAALVGMAAIFAGASRAVLTSIVFAVETTQQPSTLAPLLLGCAGSYLVSCLLLPQSIMTEKVVRKGVNVPVEYAPDPLAMVLVRRVMSRALVTLDAGRTLEHVRKWLSTRAPGTAHQGFPVLDARGRLVGIVTKRDLLDDRLAPDAAIASLLRRPPVIVYDDSTLAEAVEQMVSHDVGRLPVMSRQEPGRLVGMITRSDLLEARRLGRTRESVRRLEEASRPPERVEPPAAVTTIPGEDR